MNNEVKSRRALVTGATGFIGSNLVKRLTADGWSVHVIVRPGSALPELERNAENLVYHVHDGSSRGMVDLVREAEPDVVFHLASCFLAQHRPEDIENLVGSNLLFSMQLAEAMVANGVRYLLNTGTSWQHYQNAEYMPVNLYAATKQAFEDILTYYVDAHGLKVITLVLFDTYGPNDPRDKLFSLLCKTAHNGQELAMSPGEQLIDIVHIDDVIDAYLKALQLFVNIDGHKCYGVTSGKPITLREFVHLFESVNNCKLKINFGSRDYRFREIMVPWNMFEKLPNWEAKTKIEVGLKISSQ